VTHTSHHDRGAPRRGARSPGGGPEPLWARPGVRLRESSRCAVRVAQTTPWQARSPPGRRPAVARPVAGTRSPVCDRNSPGIMNGISLITRHLIAYELSRRAATGGTPGLVPDSGTGIPPEHSGYRAPVPGVPPAHIIVEKTAADAARPGEPGTFQTWDTPAGRGWSAADRPRARPHGTDCQSRQDCSYHMISLARQHLPLRHMVAGRPDRMRDLP
jgi:hypothetical protein